jgi:hypothetical protein
MKFPLAICAAFSLLLGATRASAQQGCEVTMPRAFRLLETQAVNSGGPDYPAQTHVRAIALGSTRRGGARAVRVRIDSAEGWIFLWPSQLRACPPGSVAQRPGDVVTPGSAPPESAPVSEHPSVRPARACVPGTTQACLCAGGDHGVQSCEAQGTGYAPCECARSAEAPQDASGLTIGGRQANFGSRGVHTGFAPDPIQVHIASGGSINASTLGLGRDCVGFVTQRPDFILRFTGPSSMLRFYVLSPGESTLIINSPDRRWHCNDDSNGTLNPMVDFPNAGTGQYDIWVGSYMAGETVRGQIYITELNSNHP